MIHAVLVLLQEDKERFPFQLDNITAVVNRKANNWRAHVRIQFDQE